MAHRILGHPAASREHATRWRPGTAPASPAYGPGAAPPPIRATRSPSSRPPSTSVLFPVVQPDEDGARRGNPVRPDHKGHCRLGSPGSGGLSGGSGTPPASGPGSSRTGSGSRTPGGGPGRPLRARSESWLDLPPGHLRPQGVHGGTAPLASGSHLRSPPGAAAPPPPVPRVAKTLRSIWMASGSSPRTRAAAPPPPPAHHGTVGKEQGPGSLADQDLHIPVHPRLQETGLIVQRHDHRKVS